MTIIRSDIAVVGAGIVGLAACLALNQAGFRVCLVSREPPPWPPDPPGTDPRVFALATASVQFLNDLGVHSLLDESRIAPVRSMCVYPSSAPDAEPIRFARTADRGTARSDKFDAPDGAHAAHAADLADLADAGHRVQVPTLAEIVEQSNILSALRRRVDQAGPRNIRVVSGEVAGVSMSDSAERIVLELSGGESVQTRLLVGADGAASPVRAMAGIPITKKSYEQTAIVARLRTERPHADCAFQWFGEHGVLALLPLPPCELSDGDHLSSMVWSTDRANAARILAAGPAMLGSELEAVCSTNRGQCEALSDLYSFDLISQQAQSLIEGRIVLLGDAAHVVHPLAGQGLNLGLADVATLSHVLGDARKKWRRAGFDPGARLLLRRYRRHRAEPLFAMQTAIDGLQRLFTSPPGRPPAASDRPVVAARDIGWQIVARNAVIRRQLMRYAAGGS